MRLLANENTRQHLPFAILAFLFFGFAGGIASVRRERNVRGPGIWS